MFGVAKERILFRLTNVRRARVVGDAKEIIGREDGWPYQRLIRNFIIFSQ